MKKLIVLFTLIAVVAGGLAYWLHERPEQTDDPVWLRHATAAAGMAVILLDEAVEPVREAALTEAVPPRYITAPVERGDVRRQVSATGTLQALITVEVGTQLSGQIARLFADFNDEVERDQPLAQLDTKSFEARLAEATAATEMAEANVEIQRARLERARVDVRDAAAQRAVLRARVDDARARLSAAERALARAESRHGRGTGTPMQVEDAETERDRAGASLREAEAVAAAHEIAVHGARVDLRRAQAELDNALASVPQHKAAERAAEIDLERATIRSPADGVVVGRNVAEGQTVAAGLEAPTLFTIAGDLRQMEIHAHVDEADIGKILVGQSAAFTLDAYPGRRFEAVVTGVRKAPRVMQNVVTYTVVLATENRDNLLLPGMTATVRITVYESGPALALPMAALRFSPSLELAVAAESTIDTGWPATVWRLAADGMPEPVAVGLGEDDGAYAELVAGALVEGDEVIIGEIAEAQPARLFGIRVGF